MLFDSHIHLDFFSTESRGAELLSERETVLAEATASRIMEFFVPGTRMAGWQELEQLRLRPTASAARIYVGVGQHPYWSSEVMDLAAFAGAVTSAAKRLDAVAIGECGLDKRRGGDMKHQIALFETQLKIARELELPCVVHSVGTQAELFASLDRVGLGPAGGVVHGFSGDRSLAQALARRGFLLGLGLAVTRTSRHRLREAVCDLPEGSYVLETDAPAVRVDRAFPQGTPPDLIRVAEELAQLRKQPFERIAAQSTENARRLFGLKSE